MCCYPLLGGVYPPWLLIQLSAALSLANSIQLKNFASPDESMNTPMPLPSMVGWFQVICRSFVLAFSAPSENCSAWKKKASYFLTPLNIFTRM